MRFEDTDALNGAEFVNVDLAGARFENVNLSGARFREAMLVDARFSGLIAGMMVNDVEVAPLITAELDRRYPERTKLRPRDAGGVRDAWSVIEALWSATKTRASAFPEPALHERVDREWSFLETFRHLVFVTDLWISGNALGQTGQCHPFGVAPTFILDVTPFGLDPSADPSFADVVVIREGRMTMVRELVASFTDDELGHRPGEHTVLRCFLTLFDEEWHHNWYANRDLDVLTKA